MAELLIRTWADLGFTAVAVPHSHHAEFKLYQIDGMEGDQPLWHRTGSLRRPDYVESMDDTSPFADGSVKWDGCSNWAVNDSEASCLHACSREEITHLSTAMQRCWDWAAEIVEAWSPC